MPDNCRSRSSPFMPNMESAIPVRRRPDISCLKKCHGLSVNLHPDPASHLPYPPLVDRPPSHHFLGLASRFSPPLLVPQAPSQRLLVW